MELNILDWFQTLHTPILDKIMTSITKLGDVGIFWIILTLLFLIIPKMRKTGIIMAAALIMDLLICNVAVKNLVARTRPYDVNTSVQLLVAKLHDYSFPSGHTASAFALATSVCPLSDGCSGWYGFWNPGRICGLPDCETSGNKAFRKKERRESDTEVTTCTG